VEGLESGVHRNCSGEALRIKDVSMTAAGGRELLADISFEVKRGDFVAIVGPSGCGKSTLVRALSGTLVVTKGSVILNGYSVAEMQNHYPLAIGYLPQFAAFHDCLDVEENLNDTASLRLPHGVSQATKAQWLRHIVGLSGLDSLLSQRCGTLSGGQRRRMALAEALISDPSFLFLDELTSGLDVYSDQEIMLWLRELAHNHGKVIVLVTHAIYHLHYCDSIIFLHDGKLVHHGSCKLLLERHGVSDITEVFALYQKGQASGTQDLPWKCPPIDLAYRNVERADASEAVLLKTAKPPYGFWQFPTLLHRQIRLFGREKSQIGLHLALIVTFPCLVAVFAIHGLPQVRTLTLSLQTNIVGTLQEQLFYLKESFHAASVISGLAMFQVVLLTLIGANNGAREIAKEEEILKKELRAGLSPTAYVSTKFLQIAGLCLIQAFWMAWFVKTICGFPGQIIEQFTILFIAVLAMSTTCLAISAASPSPERASLLAIYLVGFQLPLSGAALALPEWLSNVCRPFIVAYWGWSGYLQTFQSTRHYDIVKQSTHTTIADYRVSLIVLSLHVTLALGLAVFFVGRKRSLA